MLALGISIAAFVISVVTLSVVLVMLLVVLDLRDGQRQRSRAYRLHAELLKHHASPREELQTSPTQAAPATVDVKGR